MLGLRSRLGGPKMALAAIVLATGVLWAALTPAGGEAQEGECEGVVKVEVGIVTAEGCFEERQKVGEPKVYATTEAHMLNGLVVTPQTNTEVVYSPAVDKRVPSVSTERIDAQKPGGRVDLTVDPKHPNANSGKVTFPDLEFAISPPESGTVTLAESALAQPFPVITGITPVGVKQPIVLEEGNKSTIRFTFDISSILAQAITNGGEKSFTVISEVEDGEHALAGFGGSVKDIEIAEIAEIEELELEFEPPQRYSADFAVTLSGLKRGSLIGGFAYDKGLKRVTFGVPNLNVDVGTGVFLQQLKASLLFKPFGISGHTELTAGPKIKLLGHDFAAMTADAGLELRGGSPGYFQVDGGVKLASIPVGKGFFKYTFGVGTHFRGGVGVGLPSLRNDPGQPSYVGVWVNGWTDQKGFDLEGRGRLKVIGVDIARGNMVVSDIGAAGCVQVVVWVGGGIRWRDGRAEILGPDTCDLGGYKRRRAAAASAADGTATVRLGRDDRVVRISSAPGEEPPDVTLEHPDGRVLQSPADDDEDGIVRGEHGVALAADEEVTHFVIRKPRGRWSVTATEDPDNPSGVTNIETAAELPDHEVDAEVTGRGRVRTLRWSAADIPHQRLVFEEVLPNGREVPILDTTKSQGQFRFMPVEAEGTLDVKRKLAVDVRQRLDTPRDELVADHYRVRELDPPKRPRGLRVERQLHDLVVQWKGAKRAHAYEVKAQTNGPHSALYSEEVGRRQRTVRFNAIGTTRKMEVKVIPINRHDVRGKPIAKTIRTDDLVANRGKAAKRLVRRARLNSSFEVVSNPVCPDGGHCQGVLEVRKGRRLLGSQAFDLPADMTDRIEVKLRPGARANLRRGGALRKVRLVGTVSQVEGGSATRRRTVTLRG